jgi:hypothetical protein
MLLKIKHEYKWGGDKMIEYSNTKLVKFYPLSRHVKFCFIDLELSLKDKEHFESKIKEYIPPIKGVRATKGENQVIYDKSAANIVISIVIPNYLLKSLDEVEENIKTSFIDFYNNITP